MLKHIPSDKEKIKEIERKVLLPKVRRKKIQGLQRSEQSNKKKENPEAESSP